MLTVFFSLFILSNNVMPYFVHMTAPYLIKKNMQYVLSIRLQTIHCEIQDLKAQCLEAFATLEECRLRHERNKDPFYRDLLTSRCLDPMSERKMNEIRTHYHHVDGAIRNADMKLDNEWEAYQKEKNKSRYSKVKIDI